MRITIGSGRSRQTVELPDQGRDNHRDIVPLVDNIVERVCAPTVLLERKGFKIYDGR